LAAKGQVNCVCCSGNSRKSGSYKNRNRIVQRYACDRCGKSFSESQPLDGLRIETSKVNEVVRLLCEGVGVRATGRLTGLHKHTVLSIVET
jgi:transposase-like protein